MKGLLGQQQCLGTCPRNIHLHARTHNFPAKHCPEHRNGSTGLLLVIEKHDLSYRAAFFYYSMVQF